MPANAARKIAPHRCSLVTRDAFSAPELLLFPALCCRPALTADCSWCFQARYRTRLTPKWSAPKNWLSPPLPARIRWPDQNSCYNTRWTVGEVLHNRVRVGITQMGNSDGGEGPATQRQSLSSLPDGCIGRKQSFVY